MAKNYTIKEAVEIIVTGEDKESVMDIGRRYPVLAVKIAKVGALAGKELVEFMSYFPDHVTANKVNTAMKNEIGEESEDAGEDEETVEAPKKAAKPAKKAEVEADTEDSDYDSMTGNALVELCKERGIWKTLKDKKKGGMIAALKASDAGEGEEEVEEDAETSENPYEGKSAMELFKECKSRGIKAAPKKPAKFYADLLVKADAESEEDADADDEWEEEEEAPKKAAPKKAAPKAKAAKPAKKAEAEEEDDEDWDI